MTTLGWWIFCGKPIETSETNDLGLVRKNKEKIQKLLDIRDVMISDR